MRIVFLGSGAFGLPGLEALRAAGHTLPLIVSQPARSAGRGKRLVPTPVARWAREHAVDLLETDNVNRPEIVARIAQVRPDLLVVVAFGQKIGRELIAVARHEAINVHGSALPRWRGAAPIQWALIHGDTTTGVTIITLADRMDAGDILGLVETPIRPGETAEQLHDRLAELAAPLLVQTVTRIESGTVERRPQDERLATLAPKLKKSDGILDWTAPATVLEQRIRGLWPWPGAVGDLRLQANGQVLRITLAAAEVVQAPSGSWTVGQLDDRLCVVCGQGALRIHRLKPAGASLMDWQAFVNGRPCRPGDQWLVPGRTS